MSSKSPGFINDNPGACILYVEASELQKGVRPFQTPVSIYGARDYLTAPV
jgi:hypothetical protein